MLLVKVIIVTWLCYKGRKLLKDRDSQSTFIYKLVVSGWRRYLHNFCFVNWNFSLKKILTLSLPKWSSNILCPPQASIYNKITQTMQIIIHSFTVPQGSLLLGSAWKSPAHYSCHSCPASLQSRLLYLSNWNHGWNHFKGDLLCQLLILLCDLNMY